VEVHPSDKDLLRLELLEISKLLTILKKTIDFWAILEIDSLHGEKTDELPQNTEHEIRSLI